MKETEPSIAGKRVTADGLAVLPQVLYNEHSFAALTHAIVANCNPTLAGPGDREQAVELLREAHAAFEEMGSQRHVAVARDRLQELGATEEPVSPAA